MVNTNSALGTTLHAWNWVYNLLAQKNPLYFVSEEGFFGQFQWLAGNEGQRGD